MIARVAIALAFVVGVATIAAAQGGEPGAQSGTRRYPPAFERTVRPGRAGPNRLPVDLPLLVGASPIETLVDGGHTGLGELRLHDAAGREVPYLAVWPRRSNRFTWQTARVTPVAPGRDTSGFEADVGRVLTVDRLEIARLPERFLKRVRLEGSGDRVHWTMLVAEGTLFNLPAAEGARDVPLRQTQLAFPAGAYRYLRVIWDDHAGGKLPTDLGAAARIAPQSADGADTLHAMLAVERRPSEHGNSRYHLRLPASRLPIVAIELEVGDRLVLRPAKIMEPRLGANRQLEAVQLGDATLRRVTDGGAVAASLTIPIERPSGSELDLVVDDGDNPPLDLRAARATLAPVPFLFFVSDDGGLLRATYGGDRRRSYPPPRYDLAALRDSVDRIAMATATWDAPHALASAPDAIASNNALYSTPGAPLDRSRFSFSRSIPRGAGLSAIRLDPAAIAHSRIEDLRIVDREGRQVPYVLERLDEPTELTLSSPTPVRAQELEHPLVSDPQAWSWYRYAVPVAGLPAKALRLTTSARVFSREVAITLLGTRVRDSDANSVNSATWTHDDPETPASPLDVAMFDRVPIASLLVAVKDGDNQKLPLTSATLLLPSYRLRFFRDSGAALSLLYGRRDLVAPSYDLSLLTGRVLDAPAQEVALGPESGDAATTGRTARWLFWGALSIAVVVLLGLIARLLRSAPA